MKHANLKQRFQKRHQEAARKLIDTHTAIRALTDSAGQQILTTRGLLTTSVAAGALSGALLLAPVKSSTLLGPPVVHTQDNTAHAAEGKSSREILIPLLMDDLPTQPRALSAAEEKKISQMVSSLLKISVKAEIDNKRLNTSYGYMGSEQHLPRYAGDTINQHGDYLESGITPRTGAFGYFSKSQMQLTSEQIQQERYYFAVQTFMAPGWNENIYGLKDWFKFRKMVAINPRTGASVVGVIGDAGPAVWTGKQFGGSPEVMHELGLHRSGGKGEVLLFFVDDPENKVPLGPIE